MNRGWVRLLFFFYRSEACLVVCAAFFVTPMVDVDGTESKL